MDTILLSDLERFYLVQGVEGETFIVCCVKMEVGKPSLTNIGEGRIEINVE
ncbi:unnamed protein product [Schistosoma margrebowiei]|uniref:Uncharacterized protein n=1 Tax=Schistosoma margrebowiei TaxID=48269 RepID=A0A183M4V5_9TREM|nr:unnamed protein product [Schistosoma margrebowiei]